MSNQVDLRQLAIDRGGTAQPRVHARGHALTRYVLPMVLLMGFLSLVAWASRDFVFPPQRVTVVPVFASQSEMGPEGTPLFQAAGWIEPRPTPVRAAALAPGVVEKLLVVEDQEVKAGEPVAELVKDDAILAHNAALANQKLREAELEEAEAAQTAAETRLEQPVHLRAALSEAEASLAKIDTQLKNLPFETRRAEADREAVQKDYDGKLASKGVVAGVEIDIAKSKLDSSKALVEELRDRDDSLAKQQAALAERRNALKTQLKLLADEYQARDEAVAQVKAARARVEQARVAVAQMKLALDRMTVKAPVDGRVYRLIGHPGSRIGSGMTQMEGHDGSTVVTLYRPNMLQVRVDVRFEDIPKVSRNQLVSIDNAALSHPLQGKVLFTSSEADIQKNTLQVKIDIPNPPSVFKPEMLVDVTFLAPPRSDSSTKSAERPRLYVPGNLVQSSDDGQFLWVADQSAGVARKVAVETGAAGSDGLEEVTRGLTASSRVIVRGCDRLRDGERIRIIGEDASLEVHRAPIADEDKSRTPSPEESP